MITGNIRSQIDQIWNVFWSGRISNSLEVIERITFLLFLRRLDDLQTLEENRSTRLERPMERRVFPEGCDARGRSFFRRLPCSTNSPAMSPSRKNRKPLTAPRQPNSTPSSPPSSTALSAANCKKA